MNYTIHGDSMPAVICHLETGEKMITERGSMAWMTPNMVMETSAGGLSKAFGRMFSGESVFQNIYTASGGPGEIAFASSFPGTIIAFDIAPGQSLIAQKTAFLAATEGIELSTFFQKKGMSGFFSGEGFIMQKISGNGTVFLEIDGSAKEYTLAPGQQMVVDTGNLAFAESSVRIDVQSVKGAKNVLFGGEGLFHTVVTGPGKIVLQTMPLSSLVSLIASRIPTKSN